VPATSIDGRIIAMPVFEATDIIEMSLELEKSGEGFYRSVASKTSTEAVSALFNSLADAELEHYATFEALSKTIWATPPMLAEEWTQYMLYLQSTIQSVFFQGADKALALAEQVTDEKEALRMAMGFEKETLLFFYDLRDMVSDSDRAVMSRIIQEEKTHLKELGEALRSLKEN
jgi:rubrerythrin